jgi:hypothetical protein
MAFVDYGDSSEALVTGQWRNNETRGRAASDGGAVRERAGKPRNNLQILHYY